MKMKIYFLLIITFFCLIFNSNNSFSQQCEWSLDPNGYGIYYLNNVGIGGIPEAGIGLKLINQYGWENVLKFQDNHSTSRIQVFSGNGGLMNFYTDNNNFVNFSIKNNGTITWNDNRSYLSPTQNGSIELNDCSDNEQHTPFIDFHYGVGSRQDQNFRIINDGDKQLSFINSDWRRVMKLTSSSGMHLAGDLTIGNDENNQRFTLHSRTNNQGDFLQLTCDDPTGNWQWGKGITFNRSNGYVGFGTTNPILPLTISGLTNETGIQIGTNIDPTENYHFVSHNGWLALYNGNHGSGIGLVTFKKNGNVGIGTYNPQSKLSVDGNIQAKEIKVTQWPQD